MTTAPTTAPTQQPAQQGGRHNRSVKNYLIDSRFQLKYTSMIVGVTVVISAILGVFIYRESGEVVQESQKVVEESKKVSDVVKMSIKDDPEYGENPELAAAFAQSSSESDKKIADQQQALIRKQHTMLGSLVGGLSMMVILIGLLGIYFTHKVAGPIYKMKMLLRQVGEGRLVFRGGLRKGDELQSFFEAFQTMVEKLRERQSREIDLLESAMETARAAGASEEAMSKVALVRDEMRKSLNT
jgi:hypothetical protein